MPPRRRVLLVLGTALACLAAIRRFGKAAEPQWFLTLLGVLGVGGGVDEALSTSAYAGFYRLAFWVGISCAGYLVVPVAVIRFGLHERLETFGWTRRGLGRDHVPYLALLAIAVPFVVAASFAPEFQARYPFYVPATSDGLWPLMAAWWVLYAVQFVGVEFFFRGFLVLGLAPAIGRSAVLVAAVPYVLIHVDKPWLEMIGSALTAVAFGLLVLRSRCIWWGVVVHIAVALLLDVLALLHKGT